MRVLVLSSLYPSDTMPTRGIFVHERTRHLAAISTVQVVAPVPWFPFNRLLRGAARADTPRLEVRDGITVHHPRFLSAPGIFKSLDGLLYFASLLPFMIRLRRRTPFDLIDAHFAYPDGLAGLLLSRWFRVPLTVTLRGTEVPLSKRRLRRSQIKLVLAGADRVIAVSQSLADLAGRLGAPAERVRVIPNGIDTSLFNPGSKREARQSLGLPEGGPLLVSVGALTERKGHHRIIRALPSLLTTYPDLLLVVVGGASVEGDTGRSLRSLAQELGLTQHVRLVGACPHDQIPTWLRAADLFCLATQNEGRPNAVMEALACGLPVVTSDVGGNAEIVTNEQDGLLVPFGDPPALLEALRHAMEMRWDHDAISRRARARTWHQTAHQVATEFNAVLAERQVRPPGPPARPVEKPSTRVTWRSEKG
jgi:glycosyltransferase involved in cell wall biosynthesis